MNTAALIVAAGRGHRAGGTIPKQYQPVAGKSVLEHTLSCFLQHPDVDRICVVINPDDRALFDAVTSDTFAGDTGTALILADGGSTRQISVLNGLEALAALSPEHVLIHDAARPGVCADIVGRVIAALGESAGAIAAMPIADTVKRCTGNLVETTVPRADLWAAQTPQGFHFDAILQAHRRAKTEKISEFTDDASIAEWAGIAVHIVDGTPANTKITTQHDLDNFAMTLASDLPRLEPRTGQGYDVHAFEPGDHVMLCGVKVPHDCGLKGHSDADVGLHALTDAILGAMGDGDIGQHFPPTDPQWEGRSSDVFLAFSRDRVAERRGRIGNIDVTMVCEAPKISPHCTAMRERIADILGVTLDRISVKATTSERLGFTGRREGIAAHAIATIMLPAPDSL